MSADANIENAWGLPGVLNFFEDARATTAQVYASEWFFLKDRLKEGMSVLDVGCAQGGFASVLAEHLREFRYTGLDVNADMVARARAKHPGHAFHHVPDGDWAALGGECFDLVLVLGILHLHLSWRDTIAQAWSRTRHCLLLDLREIEGATIEDPARSYFRMDFGGGDAVHSETTIPYILVNSAEALATVRRLCPDARRISHYGYLHPLSGSAVAPVKEAMANVWCIER
jgi:SAM-dependent methyltransferase